MKGITKWKFCDFSCRDSIENFQIGLALSKFFCRFQTPPQKWSLKIVFWPVESISGVKILKLKNRFFENLWRGFGNIFSRKQTLIYHIWQTWLMSVFSVMNYSILQCRVTLHFDNISFLSCTIYLIQFAQLMWPHIKLSIHSPYSDFIMKTDYIHIIN